MHNYEAVVECFDALYNRTFRKDSKGMPIQTSTKLRNVLTSTVLTNPDGLSHYLSNIKPSTHVITGFSKPWEWYHVFKEHTDIFEYLLNEYYVSEYKQLRKISNPSRIGTALYSRSCGNKFINLYDKNELLKVRTFTNFIIDNELYACKPLLCTLAYIHTNTGKPKLAFMLYKKLLEGDHDFKPSHHIQDMFFMFIGSMYRDLNYALTCNYTHALLTDSIIYDSRADGYTLKSLRTLLSLVIEDLGHKSIFDENITYRQLISNLRKYGEYLSSDDSMIISHTQRELWELIPITFEYVNMISELTDKVSTPPVRDIRRLINSQMHIITPNDRVEIDKLYSMNVNEQKALKGDIKKTLTLFLGI